MQPERIVSMVFLEFHKHKNPYHPDITLFLVLIPFISAFNYYLTYSNISFSWFLLLTFSLDTVQGYIAWLAVRSFILYLDKKKPYGDKPLSRILIQLACTIVIGLSVISVLTELTSWIAKGKGVPLSFYTVDLFIISIWFFVINGIYIGLYYYNVWQRTEEARQEELRVRVGGLVVKHGKQNIRLTFDEVAGFYVDGEYAVVCDTAGRKYYLDQSLDKIEKTVPSIFFRLNRQFILHRQMISGFKRAENGKLQVLLNKHDSFPSEVQVSRTKAGAFKSWFHPEG
ncbi:MAG TPA: LytTR family DNA-binding domain-containing protein [Cyclobacteriaceae bacterium]